MTNHVPSATTNPEQSSGNKDASDGAPNQPADIGKGPVPDVGANLNKSGAEISEKTPHLKSHSESESLDIERSSAKGPDKDKTNLSSLTATGPRTPTRLPRKPGANRNPSGPPENLPISGLYAEFAQKFVREELRIELDLAKGATFGDAVAAVLFAAAIKGSIPAAREIREAVEGKSNQRSSRVAAEPIEVLVTYESPLSQMMPKDSLDEPNE